MRQVLAEVDAFLDTARTPADAVDAMLASVDRYSGADPVSLLFIEAYLAATRDAQLREQIGGVVEGFRQRFGRWLGERGVPAPDETAEVLVAAVDGLLLHRGLGAGPDAAPVSTALIENTYGPDQATSTAWMSSETCTVSPITTPPPSSGRSVSMPKSLRLIFAVAETPTRVPP